MYPVIFSLYDGIDIHTYGFCILIGVIFALCVAYADQWPVIQRIWPLWDTLVLSLAVGILIGSRILYWVAQKDHSLSSLFFIHQGGFSILGGLIGACIALYSISILYKQSYLSLLDVLAIYGPCVQSFARVGCFFAGCCVGCPTTAWWALWYPSKLGWYYMHPLQLYSALFYMLVFIILYQARVSLYRYRGLLGGIYLLTSALERLIQDYLRLEPTFFTQSALAIDYGVLGFLIVLGVYLIVSVLFSRRLL